MQVAKESGVHVVHTSGGHSHASKSCRVTFLMGPRLGRLASRSGGWGPVGQATETIMGVTVNYLPAP